MWLLIFEQKLTFIYELTDIFEWNSASHYLLALQSWIFFVNYRIFSLNVKDIWTEYSFKYFLFWKNFNFIRKIWLSLSTSKICRYSHTLYNSLIIRFERCKIFQIFLYNNHQHIWKDFGLNHLLFLKSLNHIKYIIDKFTVAKVYDYKNNETNLFLK